MIDQIFSRCIFCFTVCLSFFTIQFAQISPYDVPFSVEYQTLLPKPAEIQGENKFPIDFIKKAHLTILPDRKIWRLQLNFNSSLTGYLSINNCKIPNESKLFIISDKNAYTGPFIPLQGRQLLIGRFTSKKIILEYQEQITSEFEGSFIIDGILSEFDPKDELVENPALPILKKTRDRPIVMVTGYWPPTNEMVRHFSQNETLNPGGWQGENWENSGYDVVSFFPEFNPPNCNNCGQGYGDLEVDYQDFTQDFWPIIQSVNPIAIITFSRGYNDHSWELENRVVNRTNWVNDYTAPLLPTPNPPDDSVPNYHVRYTSLPVEEIISEIGRAGLGLDAYLDNTNAGMFLSEYAGYHGSWYKEDHDQNHEIPCFAGGHIHVGAQIDWDTAKQAAEISIRALIDYVDQYMVILGDCNGDGEVNILDVVALSNVILGNDEFTLSQFTASDLDNNDILNILDIIAIVNLILN